MEGDLTWDFSRVHEMDIPEQFVTLLERYLESVLDIQSEDLKGWKIPETTLIYPWITYACS